MRVVARDVDVSECPPKLKSYIGQSFVTIGREYAVYAVALFETILFAQVIDDLGYPSWRPFWLFDAIDKSLPRDWICGVFHDDPLIVLGPEFIAGDREKYIAMVELDREQVNRFWKYVEEKSGTAEG